VADAGAVVKLGGSLVTDKASAELRVDEALVERLAGELVEAGTRPLVLVHGAGSYGHRIVAQTGIHRGLSGAASLLAMGETQRLQHELDNRIAAILLAAGLPVMPVQASASAVMDAGVLRRMDVVAVRKMMEQGQIPLLYGVPAVDTVQGCSILSGDQIAPYLALHLGIPQLIHVTDVDGVFDADPAVAPEANRIDRVDRHNWDRVRVRLSGSAAVDVTGGMAGKVESLLVWARQGLSSRIVGGRVPGRLTQALQGHDVGTLVSWEE
jgi:isopentenyl phosphate kinase